MDPAAEMDDMRRRIRRALEESPDKSQKELAKLLDVSPAQVTSLLSPGGRWLQAPEVPIVERYLKIRLLKRPTFPRRRSGPGLPPKYAPSVREGSRVVFEQTHPDIVRYLKSVLGKR